MLKNKIRFLIIYIYILKKVTSNIFIDILHLLLNDRN